MKRFILILITVLAATIISIIPASAHPGRTDSNGGHTDQSTGEYHYHHGYPAHQHTDLDGDGKPDCPYNFDDRTGENSGTSGGGSGHSGGSSGYGSSLKQGSVHRRSDIGWKIFFIATASLLVLLLLYIFIQDKIDKVQSKKLRKQLVLLMQDIYQKELKISHELCAKYDGKNINELVTIPPDSEIGSDGFPKLKDCDKGWGSKYTFYISFSSTRYHTKDCRHAGFFAENAVQIRKEKKIPCKVCQPMLPDTSWVDNYFYFKNLSAKYSIKIDFENNVIGETKNVERLPYGVDSIPYQIPLCNNNRKAHRS